MIYLIISLALFLSGVREPFLKRRCSWHRSGAASTAGNYRCTVMMVHHPVQLKTAWAP